MRYSAPLDGIRAVAIIAVLIFHVAPAALTGGFTGVDVFFVLSGFLITSIILHDVGEGRFSLREFYLRRVQRLLPNLIATVAGVLVLWTWLLPASTAKQTGAHGLWTLFSASNFYIWKNLGDYWGNAAEHAPFTHTWSLGIEEQFYLLFPASVWLLTRRPRTRLGLWLLVPALLSFAASAYSTGTAPTVAFYLLPTRIWELLAGAALAATPLTLTTSSREIAGWSGLAMVMAGFVAIDEHTAFPGFAALAPTLGTVLVIIGIRDERTRIAQAFSHPVFVAIGKVSYSLYLWHWPLITLGKVEADLFGVAPLVGAMAGGIAGIALGTAAYFVVEQPLRNRGAGRGRRLATIAAGFAVAVSLSAIVAARRPIADPSHHFEPTSFSGFLFDAGPPSELDMSTIVRYYDVQFPPVPERPRELWRTGGVIHPWGGGAPKVVVMGSSHALMYSRVIDDLCRDLGVSVAFLGVDQRSVFFGEPNADEFDAARRHALFEWRPDVVFVIDRWEARGRTAVEFAAKLTPFIEELRRVTSRVVWVAQVPVAPGNNEINLREYVTWRMRNGQGLPSMAPNANEATRRQLTDVAEALAARVPAVQVLRVDRDFSRPDGSIRYAEGRQFFYADDNHLSDAGAELVKGLFRGAIRPTPAR